MSEHDDRLPMHQMLDIAKRGLQLIRGRERAEVHSNEMLQLALAHVIVIAGEAATRVSAAARARYPDIPWAKAIAARNFIVHGYDRVDYNVVWDTLVEHFPSLVTALERAIASEAD